MENSDKSKREGLFAHLPDPGQVENYRREVAFAVEANRKAIARERVWVYAGWVVCIAIAIGFLWFDGRSTPKGPWLAMFTFLVGAIELMKHFINRARVDILKEVKQAQLQILEVQAGLKAPDSRI